MSDIFISHVEEDADIALEIQIGLEEAGYSTWCYEADSMPGPSYLLQTGAAVEASKAVVVVISPHALSSRQVTNEVVRAHESGKEFIPVLRGISHSEFQNRQPEWREAVGAAASIRITQEGVATILPRIITGLKSLNINPGEKADAARIAQIRSVLNELQIDTTTEKEEPPPAEITEPEPVIPKTIAATAEKEAKARKKWIKPVVIASSTIVAIALVIIVIRIISQTEPGQNDGTLADSESVQEQESATLFSDDFESGSLDNWEIFNVKDGEITVQNREDNYYMISKGFVHATAGSPFWDDYEFSTRFALIEGTALIYIRRQVFKTTEGNQVAGYTLIIGTDRITLRKGEGIEGVRGDSVELVSSTLEIPTGQQQALTVTCQGNKLDVYISGEQVLTYEDTEEPYTSGLIAVGGLTDAHIIYDDIIVKTIPPD